MAAIAKRFNGVGNAEQDDLEQEGLIAVWKSLQRGIPPSTKYITYAMIDWTRKCRQQGVGGHVELSMAEDELARLVAGGDE